MCPLSWGPGQSRMQVGVSVSGEDWRVHGAGLVGAWRPLALVKAGQTQAAVLSSVAGDVAAKTLRDTGNFLGRAAPLR